MTSSKMEEFLTKVTSKVKSKDAHDMIEKELTNHIQALSKSYQNGKKSEEDAVEKAIQQMGNPYSIGDNLNRLHKPKIDWSLIVLFILIAFISFLPLIGGVPELSRLHYLGKQAIWVTLSIVIMFGLLFFDYRKLKKLWIYFYGIGIVLFFITHFFGRTIIGTKRWISISGINIDVIAVTLFLFLLSWAGIFSKINEFNSWKKQTLLLFLFWAPLSVYWALGNYMFSIFYILCIVMMFAFSRVNKKNSITLVVANIVAGTIFLSILLAQLPNSILNSRLTAFINPDVDPQGEGYLYNVIGEILTKAGWFGHGLDNNTITQQVLPEAHIEFVFPYLVYSLGWVFGIVLCLILLLFITRITLNAFKTKDLYGRLLVIGGATWFAVPACWNILMVFGFVPITGVSLPFISYGGSMLLIYSALLGLILNVYRRKDIVASTITKC